MGVISAAGSFQWYRNQLCQYEMEMEKATGQDAYDQLTPPQPKSSLFGRPPVLPYLSGERTLIPIRTHAAASLA